MAWERLAAAAAAGSGNPRWIRSFPSLPTTSLAPLAAGKSTLINALLSEQLLPSSNVPETSRIVALEHSAATAAGAPPRLSYAAHGATVSIESAPAIREHLRELNAAARESGSGSGFLAMEAPLHASVAFTALSGVPPEQLGGRLCVLDTPGARELSMPLHLQVQGT